MRTDCTASYERGRSGIFISAHILCNPELWERQVVEHPSDD